MRVAPTIITLLDMAPEHRRLARRDGAHDPSLDASEITGARCRNALGDALRHRVLAER